MTSLIDRPDSVELQAEKLKLYLGTLMLSKRLEAISEQENSPVISCSANFTESMRLVEEVAIAADFAPGRVADSITMLEQQFRRAILFGFEDSEFEFLTTSLGTRFDALAEGAETRENSSIAASLVESLSSDTVFTHPSQDRKLITQILAKLTKEDCRAALANFWASNSPYLFVSGPSLESLGIESNYLAAGQVLATYEASMEVPIQVQKRNAIQAFEYSDFGPAGAVVNRNEVDDLGITQVCFANNVRLNIKSTAFEKDSVNVVVRFGKGLQETPASKPALPLLTQALLIEGGLGHHTFSELNEALSAEQCALQFEVSDDCFVLEGKCTRKSASLLMRAMAAYMTDAKLRPSALRNLNGRLDSLYGSLEHTAAGLESSVLLRFLRGGDPRFGIPLRSDLEALTIEDVRQWIAEPMSRSHMEVCAGGVWL